MMNEENQSGNGPLRPQVIELDAEEIRTEPEATRTGSDESSGGRDADAPPAARDGTARRNLMWIAAALILGLLAGGWLYRDVLASYFPSDEMTAMKARLDALETNGAGLAEQIASLKQEADGTAGDGKEVEMSTRG